MVTPVKTTPTFEQRLSERITRNLATELGGQFAELSDKTTQTNVLLAQLIEAIKASPKVLELTDTQVELIAQRMVVALTKPPIPPGLPFYNVREFLLDTARTDEEVQISGDLLVAWTDGTLIGCKVKLEQGTEDAIPLDKFNPVTYPRGWSKFYLTTTAQSGKILYLFVGRAAGAETSPELTTSAGREVFYTIRSDKDTHFTGALGQYAKEDENLSGMITNKAHITGITLVSDQQLWFKVLIWSKDTFDDTNLDLDTLLAEVDIKLDIYGWQVDGSGPWRLDMRNLALDVFDDDNTNELHISLMNMSGTGKVAGASGEVVIQVTYSPMT